MIVTDLEKYQIRFSQNYESTYKKTTKDLYKKDKGKKKYFPLLVKMLNEFYDELENTPCRNELAKKEGHPKKTTLDENRFELRKKRWTNFPGMVGNAAYGRVIYVVDKQKKEVHLIWFYTHKEYHSPPNTRPPDRDLKKEIELVTISNQDTPEFSS